MTRCTDFRCLAILLTLLSLGACDSGSGGAGTVPSAPERPTANAAPGVETEAAATEEPQGGAKDTADAELDISVVGETLPYAEVGNQLVYGHFVFPANMVDPLPGLIVIHEWLGLTDDVRETANRIAAEGFVVLAVDLFGGRTSESPDDVRSAMIEVVENPEFANENIRQALDFLIQTAQAPRTGVLGLDFGGGWSLNSAILLPDELDAVVIFYGTVSENEVRLAGLNAAVLGLFAENDRSIPLTTVRSFEQVLQKLGKTYEIEIYPDVEHSFANPSSPNYNAQVAEQAWSRTFEFLNRYLSVSVD